MRPNKLYFHSVLARAPSGCALVPGVFDNLNVDIDRRTYIKYNIITRTLCNIAHSNPSQTELKDFKLMYKLVFLLQKPLE